MEQKPLISINYCPKCGWLMRSAYFAQELLTTFTYDIMGVTLLPSQIGGVFAITVGDKLIFDRAEFGRFPEIKELKKLVRDLVNPEKNLGHTDKN